MDKQFLAQSIRSFTKLHILVIGDVILDAYYKGKVTRVSPEAPVPVLDVESIEYRLGGAANVALNVKNLGASCTVCSVIGEDSAAEITESLLKSEHLSCEGLVKSKERKTSLKSRMVSGFTQLLRMDEEITESISDELERTLYDRISSLIETSKPDAIIFEDYDKGVITPTLIKRVIESARSLDIPITVDPKRNNFLQYTGATLFKPNLKELREGLNIPNLSSSVEDLSNAFDALRRKMACEMVMFTLSSDGIYITNGNDSVHIEAMKRNIADVSGAGDTVIATATCALAMKLEITEIAFLSNLAGGFVCQFPGVVSVSADSLVSEIEKVLIDGH